MVSEEIELYAAVEAPAVLRNVRNIIQHMTEVLRRTTEAHLNRIKYASRLADYRRLVTQNMQALNVAASVPTVPSIEDEKEDEQPYFSSESDNDLEEDSPPVKGGEESIENQLHGAIHALIIRARWIEFQ